MSEADTKLQDASQQAPPAQTEHAQVAEQIEEIAAADGASVLGKLSSAKAADVAQYLDPDTAANIMMERPPREVGGDCFSTTL